jgi:thioredoxin reductase (NADPH)
MDAVLLQLGFKADMGPIKNWGLSLEKRSLRVNTSMATNMPGVYAAGDIAGGDVKLDLIAVGFGQAAIAVNSAKTYIDPKARLFPGHSSELSPGAQPKAS